MLRRKGYFDADKAALGFAKKISPGGVGAKLKRFFILLDRHIRHSESVRTAELVIKSVTGFEEMRK